MSIMRCEKHDRSWDSDKLEECPACATLPECGALKIARFYAPQKDCCSVKNSDLDALEESREAWMRRATVSATRTLDYACLKEPRCKSWCGESRCPCVSTTAPVSATQALPK